MTTPIIQVNHLSKTYSNGVEALKDVHFEIKQGEKVVLLGHNGSGKSSLFRCISQFEKPTTGNVLVNGTDMTNLSRRKLRKYRRQIGVVFQHFNLVYNLSVFQNVLFGAMGRVAFYPQVFAPFASSEIRMEAMKCLEQVGLSELANRRADELSGGQKQRVAIARMLMQKPSIVLADEPIASLDPKAGKEIMALLKEVTESNGMTVISILHHIDIALEFGDRVIALKQGEKVLDFPVSQIERHSLSRLYDLEELDKREEEVS
ncbi:phosphonate ABC transporter ATP-binding protein [Alkalihalobacillus sp. 1P02AB]|uniref:phosphonate ABC transporter ATP-binding protein n=1 Tax=Alkalihalobacillus sp. 1P02AB TaxID=3132260 RepID=UPI0039A559E0